MSRRSINILDRSVGQKTTVGWYEGSSEESILRSVFSAVKFEHKGLVDLDLFRAVLPFRDHDGNIVALSSELPNGMDLIVDTSRALELLGGGGSSALQTTEFRGQVLKFERVQAHLANERTWLAWVRTALAALSVSFSLLSLSDDASVTWLALTLFVIGCFMVINVLFTFITGWLRYVRVKDVLMLTQSQLSEDFGRFGLSHHARYLSIVLVAISAAYLLGTKDL